ncbi:Oidioi.mRNA.OKI2018_I69.chr2.g6392.t1.cds [Oikopleura dioica]|uniref:Oidioi.mRNA.OKI2018_I69.chr2.g6392.t1.cds n=1 Tax=Oikopleura dioica TaxID=34765 RepID=A0ABN7T3V2_OIKDI|nr:Oidioi.mRNA.OKI2018_I69.chr2.g6392.t1.cds [Oikopleura dioica]
MQNQMVRPGMPQGGPRPMRPSFNPAGRPGLSQGSSNSPRHQHPHAPMRGAGPMRPDMKRGPRPVQPGQRMQMRPQRPHFSGAAPGPSSRPSMPPQSRPGMQGPGVRPGRPEGAVAPIRAVQSPSPRTPLNPQARPQGLKPIRGLPIGASVKIKTNVKVPNKQAAPPVAPVKPDPPSQKTSDSSENALQQYEVAKAPESQNSAANNQPTETEPEPSKTSIPAKSETKTEESAPPETPPPAKELPKPPPPENDSSEDELQIDESVEPDAVG